MIIVLLINYDNFFVVISVVSVVYGFDVIECFRTAELRES